MSLSDVVKKVVSAPRHIKEGAEEIGEKAERAYHEKREEPVRQAAQQAYEEKHKEAREKLKRGDISRELYEARNKRYLKQRDADIEPIEKKVVHSAKDIAVTVQKGAKEVIDKAAQDYRPSPPPKFGRSKGVKARAGAARAVGKKSGQPDFSRSTISFGSGPSFGGSAVDFNRPTINSRDLSPGGNAIDFSAPLFGKAKLRR